MSSSLIRASGAIVPQTGTQEMDALSAVVHGLAEYVKGLSLVDVCGRPFSIDNVIEIWATPEQIASFPSVAVYPTDKGVFDASRMSPGYSESNSLGNGIYLLEMGEFTIDLNVELWASDAAMRRALTQALCTAFCPVDWMYGFRLTLPHYFSAIAEYEPKRLGFMDSETDAMKKHRLASFTLAARVPYLRAVTTQPGTTQIKVQIDTRPPDVIEG